MELFLLRHGDAITEAPKDDLRPLSILGNSQVDGLFKLYGGQLSSVQRIFVSPYLRAQQTYEVALPYLPKIGKQDADFLTPSSSPYHVIDFLSSYFNDQGVFSVLLIGHQPLLGVLLDLFCGLETGAYRMGTSSLAAIDMDIPGVSMGTLRWLKHPEKI